MCVDPAAVGRVTRVVAGWFIPGHARVMRFRSLVIHGAVHEHAETGAPEAPGTYM